jgi:hypothetical protein
MKKLTTLFAAAISLCGYISAPNTPSAILSTKKTPEQYAQCIVPKWKSAVEGTTLSQHRNQYTIVAPSKLAANQILEVHPESTGSEVSLYLRSPLVLAIGHSQLEAFAKACL